MLITLGITILLIFGGSAIWIVQNGNNIIADTIHQEVEEKAQKKHFNATEEAKQALSDMIHAIRQHKTWNGMLIRHYIQLIIADREVTDAEQFFMQAFLDHIASQQVSKDGLRELLKSLEERFNLPMLQTGFKAESKA